MPVHDWTRVSAGTFHHFHTAWIAELAKSLNRGLLPPDYYALSEQVAGETGPDVLTLHAGKPPATADADVPPGATAVAQAPPRVSITASADEAEIYARKRRTLVIRHSSGDEIVAFLEILSPGNKSSRRALERFLDKAAAVLLDGRHLLVVDLFPPGPFDPRGIHGALWADFSDEPYEPPPGKPLTLAAYSGGPIPRAWVEPIAVGSVLPEMPLFLDDDYYVNVPLEATYGESYESVPDRWRRVIEGLND